MIRAARAFSPALAHGDARGDRDDVLQRTGELDAQQVVGWIGTERMAGDAVRHRPCHAEIVAGDRDRGRQPARHLEGEGRAGQGGNDRVGPFGAHDLAQAQPGRALQPLAVITSSAAWPGS